MAGVVDLVTVASSLCSSRCSLLPEGNSPMLIAGVSIGAKVGIVVHDTIAVYVEPSVPFSTQLYS